MGLRRLRQDGLPGKRPTPAERLNGIGLGMEWDAQAKEERETVAPYRGSREESDHRSGRNTPTARNGSNQR